MEGERGKKTGGKSVVSEKALADRRKKKGTDKTSRGLR